MLRHVLPFLAALAIAAVAEDVADRLDTKFEVFHDRNDVTAVSPVFLLTKGIGNSMSVEWEGQLDAVTGASRKWGTSGSGQNPPMDVVDVVSGASGGGSGTSSVSHVLDGISGASGNGNWEYRAGTRVGLTWSDKGRVLTGSIYGSKESDYQSISPSIGGSWDFAERNTTLSWGATWFFDKLSPYGAWAQLAGGDKRIQSYNLGLAQILTPLTLVGVNGTFTRTTGAIGLPYNPPTTRDSGMLPEKFPSSKDAVALSGQVIQGFHLADLLGSVSTEYRWYMDSWDLRSNTVTLRWSQHLSDATIVRLQGRWYKQTGAAFASTDYIGTEVYRTADIRYFPFSSYLVGAKISSAFPDDWKGVWPTRWDLSYDHLWRDTHGNPYLYQLYPANAWYMQGTFRAGLSWDLE
jgi:hypothetical protein